MPDIHSRFGRQPAHALLVERGVAFSDVARRFDFDYAHLMGCLLGRTRPSPEVIEALSSMLDAEASTLFTDAAMTKPYRRPSNSAVKIKQPR